MQAQRNQARAGTTCVVADDHPPILDCLIRYLGSAGFDVVGTAPDGARALESVVALKPRVCIADVRMPKLDGLELARKLAKEAPETSVLLYSGISDRGLVSDALDAGARGFALKDAPLDDLGRAVDTIAAGGLYVEPRPAAALPSSPRGGGGEGPSQREREGVPLLPPGG